MSPCVPRRTSSPMRLSVPSHSSLLPTSSTCPFLTSWITQLALLLPEATVYLARELTIVFFTIRCSRLPYSISCFLCFSLAFLFGCQCTTDLLFRICVRCALFYVSLRFVLPCVYALPYFSGFPFDLSFLFPLHFPSFFYYSRSRVRSFRYERLGAFKHCSFCFS